MARKHQGQQYSAEEKEYLNQLIEESELTKAEIAEKFLNEFPESGRKIENLKIKIGKMAQEKGIDLKERVRAEARGAIGAGKMTPKKTVSGKLDFEKIFIEITNNYKR